VAVFADKTGPGPFAPGKEQTATGHQQHAASIFLEANVGIP
jgi:hypothetical protein